MKRVITINRTYGSDGREIGKALAVKLGIHYYDKQLLKIISERKDIPYEELAKVDEKRASMWLYPVNDEYQMEPKFRFEPMNDVLFGETDKLIRELAEKGDCIIIGRCANAILKDCDSVKSIFIHAPLEARLNTVMRREQCDLKEAKALIRKMDKQRRYYYNYYTDQDWMDMEQYHLCLDSSKMKKEEMLDILTALYRSM